MSRLQALRECEYAQKTRTCTCYSDVTDTQVDRVDNSVRLVFDSLSDCSVVHGSLYSCLRAIFGLSIAGVLISVFSCMLVYQLLSHERKKMYWEQLELRCRSLYTSQQASLAAAANVRGPICRCCEQYHAHRQLGALQTSVFPWEEVGEPRFWAAQQPGNYYSPNPGAEAAEPGACRYGMTHAARSRISGWSWPRLPWQRSSPDTNARFRQMPSSPDSQYGFSNAVTTNTDHIMGEEQTAAAATAAAVAAAQHAMPAFNMVPPTALPYGVWGPPPPYSDPNSPARRNYYHYMQTPGMVPQVLHGSVASNNNNNNNNNNMQTATTTTNNNRSNNTATTGNINQNTINNGNVNNNNNSMNVTGQNLHATTNILPGTCEQTMNCINYRTFMEANANTTNGNNGQNNIITTADVNFCDLTKRSQFVSNSNYKLKSDDDHHVHHHHVDNHNNERFVNTLPARKVKKRFDIGAISIGPHVTQHHSQQRMHVQQVFATMPETPITTNAQTTTTTTNLQQQDEMLQQQAQPQQKQRNNSRERVVLCKAPPPLPINRSLKTKSNMQQRTSIQTPTHNGGDSCANEESELYFADVSSCCNVSVQNDNFYEEASRRLQQQQNYRQINNNHNNNHNSNNNNNNPNNNNNNINNNNNNDNSGNEDYLHQRINPLENVPRSLTTNRNKDNNNKFTQQLNLNLMNNVTSIVMLPKDQSMYSMESETKTEFTDLSPATPSTTTHYETPARYYTKPADPTLPTTTSTTTISKPQQACFVSSTYPRQTEIVHSYEARRLPTKQMTHEAHYEIVNDLPCQFNNVRLMTTPRSHAHAHNHAHAHSHAHAHNARSNVHSRMKRHHDLSALATTTTTTTNKTKTTQRTPERTIDTIASYDYNALQQAQHKSNGSKERGSGNDERRRL